MKLTTELLLKYADGQLDPDIEKKIELLLASDAIATEHMRLIRLSGKALECEAVKPGEPLPSDTLAQSILAGDLDPQLPLEAAPDTARENPVRPVNLWSSMQIAASIALLVVGLSAGYFLGDRNSPAETKFATAHPQWLVRIVDYHTLYGRETVAPSHANTKIIKDLKHRFTEVLGQQVVIPDLGRQQLEFRRGQYLKFNDSPIIQLAYLPTKTGRPVALCMKASRGKDSQASYFMMSGLGVVQWRQKGVNYVLVGDLPESRLRSAAGNAQTQIEREKI